jgi:hypothetical protein
LWSPTAWSSQFPKRQGRGTPNLALIFEFSSRGRERPGAGNGILRLVRFGAMSAAFKVRPTQLVRELLGETEGDREPVRCPDRQNTKIVGTELDLEFP